MKEVIFDNYKIMNDDLQEVLCAYGNKRCNIDCPHFEYVPKGTLEGVGALTGRDILSSYAIVNITCSGSPVPLKVKESNQ